jgi:hypothetical protein
MNVRGVVIAIFLVIAGGTLAVKLRESSLPGKQPTNVSVPADIPVPPKEGPFGKLVVLDDLTYNFGTMEQGQSGEHEFHVRNDGAGPLKLVARSASEDHSCQCTVGSLGKEVLQPGEETTVKLAWTIKQPVTRFDHWAKIRTDDPQNQEKTFRIRGLVGRRLVFKPEGEVNVGRLSETQPTERVLTVHSEIADAFTFTKIQTTNPAITVTTRPLTAEELKKVTVDPSTELARDMARMQDLENKAKASQQGTAKEGEPAASSTSEDVLSMDEFFTKTPEAKSGYELKIAVEAKFPVGKVREAVTLHTDIPDTPPLVLTVQGVRAGPVEILGTPGVVWSPEESILRLGRFPASEGKKGRLLVFIKKSEQEIEVTNIKASPAIVKCELKKDENFKAPGRDKYDLLVEVPAGSAPLAVTGEGGQGLIELELNHPEATKITFTLDFTSF